MVAKRQVKRRKKKVTVQPRLVVLGLFVLLLFTLVALGFPTYFGSVGRWLSEGSSWLMADAAIWTTLSVTLALLVSLTRSKDRYRITSGLVLLALCFPLLMELFALRFGVSGGLVGGLLKRIISPVGPGGALLVLFVMILWSVLAITGVPFVRFIAGAWQLTKKGTLSFWKGLSALGAVLFSAPRGDVKPVKPVRRRPAAKDEAEAGESVFSTRQESPPYVPPEVEPDVLPEQPPVRVEKPEALPPVPAGKFEQIPLPSPPYVHPSLGLLNRGLRQAGARGSKEERENIRTLEETLHNFGISARVVEVTRGPTYTRYEIQTAPGTKVSKVKALTNDITMSLASEDVRIEAPIPGKAAIGIEVPNKARTAVTLRDVLDSSEFDNSASFLTVALGKDIEGNTVVADLSQMPHLLIAGATGAGKSVSINSMICSILFKATPDQVRFLLIDPKMVELSTYNGIPHLLAPVLNHPKKAAAALKWAVQEMERRYALFARTGVRDIERYNELMRERNESTMFQTVIIIDELADLMMVARAEVEDAICRLAQMARAAGMHLVVGTQRPSTDVITGLIKANIPSRLSFTVSSSTDSRVILDTSGAEKLLGRGDMLFLPVGWSKPKRIQGAFVSNREIEKIVDHVSTQGEAQYVQTLNLVDDFDNGGGDGELDERFDEAVRVVVEAGQASVSMLQRRMRLGYTRAARIVDQMFEQGIVGPSEGSKPRQINRNKDIVKQILASSQRSEG